MLSDSKIEKLYEEHMSINNCQLCNIVFNKDIKNHLHIDQILQHFDNDAIANLNKVFMISN